MKFPSLAILVSLGATSLGWLPITPSPPALIQQAEATRTFAYDSALASDLKETSAREQNGVVVRDINYSGYTTRHGRISAYLVKPNGPGPFAGVLFFHWLGEVKSDRSEFLEEAVELARQGVVSLLIQGYFPWTEAPVDGPKDRQQVIDQTIEVRRGLDLLLSQPNVDAKRIGFVGHDYGAMFGAINAGLDQRVKTYIVMAALGNFSDWSLKYWPKTAAKGEDAYRKAVQDLDPMHYVARAAPAVVLFQFANNDKYISKEAASSFFDAASEPKQVKWYDARHDLNVDAARKDRREWLMRQLGLPQ